MQIRQRRDLEHDGLGAARKPGQHCRQGKCHQLEPAGRIAERDRPLFILADRLQHLSEGRAQQPVDETESDQEDRQNEVIHVHRVAEVDHPEQPTARHRLDAILAMGPGGLDRVEHHDLRQRQRDHREVEPLPADREPAEQRPDRRRKAGARKDRQLRRPAPDRGGMGRAVG